MRQLRFDRRIYSGRAVDAALEVLQGHAKLARVEDPDAWVVDVEGRDPQHERRVAGELQNHALGLTVEQGGPDSSDAQTQEGR